MTFSYERPDMTVRVRAVQAQTQSVQATIHHPFFVAHGLEHVARGIRQIGSRLFVPMLDEHDNIASGLLIGKDLRMWPLACTPRAGGLRFTAGSHRKGDDITVHADIGAALVHRQQHGGLVACAFFNENLVHLARSLRARNAFVGITVHTHDPDAARALRAVAGCRVHGVLVMDEATDTEGSDDADG